MNNEVINLSKNYDARIVAKILNYDFDDLRELVRSVDLKSYVGENEIENFDKIGLIENLSNLDLPLGILAQIYQKLEIDGDEENFAKLSADEIEKIF